MMGGAFYQLAYGLCVRCRTGGVEVIQHRLADRAPDGLPVADVIPLLFEIGRDLRPHGHGDLDLVRPRAVTVRATIERLIESVHDLALFPVVDGHTDGLRHTRSVAASGLSTGGER